MTGRVEAIWIKPERRAPMDPVESATLMADAGLVGNANQGGRRQVTLIREEKWDAVAERLDAEIDPVLRRANLMVSGVELQESTDRVLRIADTRLRIGGETKPCPWMDEEHPGLQAALGDVGWGGGAYGVVLEGGEISVGDAVAWEDGTAD